MKKRVILSFTILLTLFCGIFMCQKLYVRMNEQRADPQKLQTVGITATSSNFARNNIIQTKGLDNLNEQLIQKNYIGSYMITKNNSVINSAGFGYSNNKSQLGFLYGTTVRVGKFEALINITLLQKLVKEKNIQENENLKRYLPELSQRRTVTLKKLMNNNTGLTVNVNKLRGLNEKEATDRYFWLINHASNQSKNTESSRNANNMLVAILIGRISKTSYAQEMSKIIDKYDLSNSWLINKGKTVSGKQDAVSYHYSTGKDGAPSYDKPYNAVDKSFVVGIDQMRMSIMDIANTVYFINRDMQLNRQELEQYCDSMGVDKLLLTNHGVLSITSHGYSIDLLNANHANKLILLVSNYNNKDIDGEKLVSKIFEEAFK